MSNYQSDQIKLINTSLIDPHPDNPRKQIGDVTDLAASIKANGLLSPLSVVPNGERYRVIAGHRRLAACKQAGTGAVPCFVLDLDPLQQLEAMVTENCQREQLTALEEADAIQGMLDLGATTAAVAHRLGRSADYVRDRAKAASIKADVRKTRDDFGHLHAIKRDKLIETTARLGLLQIIDPFPNGFTDALTSWNEHSGSRKEYEKISGIAAEDAPTAARISLQTADWATVNDTSRRIHGYYQILQDLGYTPADDETSHLDQLAAAISEADENEEDEENNQ